MRTTKKIFLAEMLRDKGIINQDQLDRAVAQQKSTDKKIGEILVEMGFIAESNLLQLLAEQLHIDYIDLKKFPIDTNIIKILPEFYCRHFRCLVLKDDVYDYYVGFADPQDLLAHDEIERILKKPIKKCLIREEDLLNVLNNIYRRSDEISHFAETLSAELKPSVSTTASLEKDEMTSEDMPVVNMLRSIFEDAAQVRASDIHIEPDERVLRIRLRVDGVLQEQIIDEKSIAQALVQRIKMMANLNIAERRLPQDGRFSLTVSNNVFDVRVSTMPVQFGESVVMRLLNQSADVLKLDQIGMPEEVFKHFKKLLHASFGILLIVGPTGSGKTTTLYASLNDLNSPEDKIITVEDPVEYRLPRISQVQVNNKIDLTFASVLRSILRQDPDIVMIGELRDHETIEIAMRAAMTGHMVLGTLHTNDTISTSARLLDMGVEGYLIATVIRGILAQRLVRKICDNCAENYTITEAEKIWLESTELKDFANTQFKHGKGCRRCHDTGYLGRVGLYELLVINDELAEALRVSDARAFKTAALKQPVYRSLTNTGLDLAAKGVTTVIEVMKMAGDL